MIIELVVGGAALAGVGYLVGTKRGKAEVAALKADVEAELPKVESAVSSAEASVKTAVSGFITKAKALLAKL